MDIDTNHLTQFSSHFEAIKTSREMNSNNKFTLEQKVFKAMDQLEGWCSHFKASVIMDLILLIKAQTVVEVGVGGGKSLVPMGFALKAQQGGKAFAIDPWINLLASSSDNTSANKTDKKATSTKTNGSQGDVLNYEVVYRDLLQKVFDLGLQNHIELMRCSSDEAPIIQNIDFLHINCSETAAIDEVKKWVPLVKAGGFVIFDGILLDITDEAIAWLNSHCTHLREFHESSDWGIWVKNAS